MSSEEDRVFITIEYPDDIEDEPESLPPFQITLKSHGKMTTMTYQGDFVTMLLQQSIQNLFSVTYIIDQFGFVPFFADDDEQGGSED